METVVLELFFTDSVGAKIKISIQDPDTTLLPSEIRDEMETILEQETIVGRNGVAIALEGAQIVTKTISEMDL